MSSPESSAAQRATKRQRTTQQEDGRHDESSKRRESLNGTVSDAQMPDGRPRQTHGERQNGPRQSQDPVIRQQQDVILRDDHDAAYTPLKPHEVRFMVLRSGSYKVHSSINTIEVEFRVESTDSEKIEAYEALSYVWGGLPSDSVHTVRVWIKFNTYVELPITWALYYALVALRGLKNRRLWADALCINQKDDTERSKQVAKMGWILSTCNERPDLSRWRAASQ